MSGSETWFEVKVERDLALLLQRVVSAYSRVGHAKRAELLGRLDAAIPGEVTEYAIEMSGGGMHVRNPDPEIERIYPLAEWIEGQRRQGGHVWQRRVIAVEDWTEVTGPPPVSRAGQPGENSEEGDGG